MNHKPTVLVPRPQVLLIDQFHSSTPIQSFHDTELPVHSEYARARSMSRNGISREPTKQPPTQRRRHSRDLLARVFKQMIIISFPGSATLLLVGGHEKHLLASYTAWSCGQNWYHNFRRRRLLRVDPRGRAPSFSAASASM